MSLSVDIRKKIGNFRLDVTFNTEGGVTGLLGASGCGKSMTLKCIAGIERPDEGKIVLDGRILFDSEKKINLPPGQRKVGYLFQDYALFPNMTVFQNILCGARDKEKAQEYLERFCLKDKEKQYPAELSGGEKQRVAMARMLAAQPDAILLDEPFSALDNFLKAKLEREICNVLDDYDKPVVFVSHDRNESYRLTDVMAVMENGRIVDISEKHVLFRNPKTLASTLLTGCKNVSRLERREDGNYLAADWGIVLPAPNEAPGECARDDKPASEYRFAAVRAHDFVPASAALGRDAAEQGGENGLVRGEIFREIEDTFSFVIQFYGKGNAGRGEYSLITYETDKEAWRRMKKNLPDGEISLLVPKDKIIWLER